MYPSTFPSAYQGDPRITPDNSGVVVVLLVEGDVLVCGVSVC
jgi:hypothetical protein